MKILLTGSQLQAISEFCLDVAKGLMLAGILGQGFILTESAEIRTVGSIGTILLSLGFLYFGVHLREEI